MITARELRFIITAKDDASRVVRRVGTSFGSLNKIKSLQAQASAQQVRNLRQVAAAQQKVLANEVALERAQVQASKLSRITTAGGNLAGYTKPETAALANAATLNVQKLRTQEGLLAKDLDEVRKAGDAASASLDRQVSVAKIARVESYAQAVQNIGKALRLVGAVAAVSLGIAAVSAAKFNQQLTLAASQARPVGAGANVTANIQTKLQGVVLKQMQQFPASSQEMADSLYQIFSSTSVQNIGQAASMLTTFNKAAVAGGSDLGSMTDAAITLFNNFVGKGKEFSNITQALNVFFSAVRYGRTNATQFAASLSNVIGIATEAGLKFTDVADAMAILTRQTGANTTSRDATGLARLIEQLSKPSMIKGLAGIGVHEIDPVTNKLKPLLTIVTEIKENANLKGVNALNFFKTMGNSQGTIQARRVLAFLLNNVKDYHTVAGQVTKDNNEFEKSFQALSKSPGVKWAVLINQLKALAILIGTQAIPAFVKMGQPLVKLLKWFNDLSSGQQKAIGYFGAISSVALVLGGSLLVLLGYVTKLVLTIKLFKLAAIGSEAGLASVSLVVLVGALTALGLILYKDPHLITQLVSALGGLKGILILVTVALIAMKAISIISWLSTLAAAMTVEGTAAEGAAVRTEALRLSLLKLKTLGPLAIAVVVTEIFLHKGQIDKSVGNALDKAHLGFLGGTKESQRTKTQLANSLGNTSSMNNQLLQKIIKQSEGTGKSATQAQNTLNQIFGKSNPALTEAVPKPPNNSALVVTTDKIKAMQATVAKAAKDSSWQKLFNNVVKLDKLSQTNPSIAKFEALQNAEDALQKASTGNQYQAAQQMLSALESTWNTAEKSATKHSKNLAAIQKKNVANAKDEISTVLTQVQSMYDNLLQQNQTTFGDLFSGPVVNGARVQDNLQYGGKVTSTDLLKDIKAQVFQFNRINSQVNQLAKKGAPKAFLDQVRAMGPDAATDIKALQQLTPAQFKQYIAAWNKGQTAIKANTNKQLNAQLKIYESHGKKIALAILKGVQSENVALSNALKQTVLDMFPGLASQSKQTPKSATGARIKVPTKVSGEAHVHYHVTAPTSEHTSIKTQIKHANLIARNTYKGNDMP